MLVIPALEGLRLEDCELEASLSYIVKSRFMGGWGVDSFCVNVPGGDAHL